MAKVFCKGCDRLVSTDKVLIEDVSSNLYGEDVAEFVCDFCETIQKSIVVGD